MPGARLAEILVDNVHTVFGPAEGDSAIDKAILQLGAFLVMLNLRHRRLTNVDVGKLRTTRWGEPFVRGGRDGQHHVAPSERPLPSASSYSRGSRRLGSWFPPAMPSCEFRRIPARHTDLMPAAVPK